MRHGVNLAAHLQFKTSPKNFEQANKATNEHIKRAAQILAKRGKTSIDDTAEIKALCKQVVAVSARTVGSPYNMPLIIEGKCLQDGHILVHLVFFLLLTRSKLGVLFVKNYAMMILLFNIILI